MRVRSIGWLVAITLLVTACARSPDDVRTNGLPDGGSRVVEGRVLEVRQAPGCGIFLTGSPVTYEIVAGPLRGQQIVAIVACIEMPLHDGDVKTFVVGDRHRLQLTRVNVRRVELPSELPGPFAYYLQGAWKIAPR